MLWFVWLDSGFDLKCCAGLNLLMYLFVIVLGFLFCLLVCCIALVLFVCSDCCV